MFAVGSMLAIAYILVYGTQQNATITPREVGNTGDVYELDHKRTVNSRRSMVEHAGGLFSHSDEYAELPQVLHTENVIEQYQTPDHRITDATHLSKYNDQYTTYFKPAMLG